jgi:hypothetical protein
MNIFSKTYFVEFDLHDGFNHKTVSTVFNTNNIAKAVSEYAETYLNNIKKDPTRKYSIRLKNIQNLG